MAQPNQPPARLVQIEPLKRAAAPTNEPQLPQLSDAEVFRRKAYIGFRRITGFFYAKHSYGAARRWLLSNILPDRVLNRWAPYRRGTCNRCGMCCKIVFRCPFFHEEGETTACLIYTSEKHSPSACVTFPFDPQDIREVHREIAPVPCPFHFIGEPEHPTLWGALKADIRTEWGKKVDKLKEVVDF